jgi:outer membrane protein OmpA-like peptidoglycan-associated protein
MTHLAPPAHLRTAQHRRRWRLAAWLIGLGLAAASSAQAQTLIGGSRAPSVAVDLTVLDQLGPAPNLPQLFSASRPPVADTAQTAVAPRPTAHAAPQLALDVPAAKTTTKKKHPANQRVAHRKSPPDHTRLALAPASQPAAAAPDRSIHLVSPAVQAGGPRVTRDPPLMAPPIQPASVAVSSPVPAPAPMPKLPQSEAAPPPPALAPSPAHDDAPNPPPQPPAQAHSDSAPVSLTASPSAPASTQTTAADSQTVSAANNVTPATRPAQVQVASAASMGSVVNTVKFATGATDLPANSQSVLDTVAAKLMADDALRVQLVAHATGSADQAMEARRVSLARAVAVRAYLIDKGVRSLRMDVRALGNRSDDAPATDQVDLVIVSQ